jgi:YnbE-like lipoprotein
MRTTTYVSVCMSCLLTWSCTPRVEVAAPEKPITINLNVKIDHEVQVKVEKDLEGVFSEDSQLF